MKKLVILFLFFASILQAQSLYDLMSQEGLRLGSISYEFSSGSWVTSTLYGGADTLCGLPILVYFPYDNLDHSKNLLIHIDGEKIYQVKEDCDPNLWLLYDYSLNVGDTIKEGQFMNYILDTIYNVELLNGETRHRFDFRIDEDDVFNPDNTSWIYGIGDIKFGFIPFVGFERASSFICAHIDEELIWENSDNFFEISCELGLCFSPRGNFEYSNDKTKSTFQNTSLFSPTNFWNFGDGKSSSETNPTHEYEYSGCYLTTLRSTAECREDTAYLSKRINICINNAWESSVEFDSQDLTICKVDEDIEIAFNTKDVFKSLDRGSSWIALPVPFDPVLDSNTEIKDLKFFNQLI